MPGGPFIRGHASDPPDPWSGPQTEVRVSTFLIDRYPFTIRRYLECVDAGVCSLPFVADYAASWWRQSENAEYPMFAVTFSAAEAFCAWDGRRLPTDAEWEKTARGPAPRSQLYPWGDTPSCERIGLCEPPAQQAPLVSVRAFPLVRSYYGADLMVAGVTEWASDYFSTTYYADPGSRDDPQGPAEPEVLSVGGRVSVWRSTRGLNRFFYGAEDFRVALRRPGDFGASSASVGNGVRCARSLPD